jgi:protein-disulfide isomerase
MKILTRYGVGAMVTIMSLVAPGYASAEITAREKEEIVEMVIYRIKHDPTIALELLSTLQKSASGDTKQARDTLKSAPRMIELVEGNPQGDIVIMDFSDYGCEACNGQSKALLAAASHNSRIKIVLRDLPRSGDDALQASVDLIAAASAQKDWRAIRRAYLSGQIRPEMRIVALAEGHSYPSEADRDLAQIALDKNTTLAERSGIEKGPAAIIIIGDQVKLMPSPVSEDNVGEIIAASSGSQPEKTD